MPDPSVAHEHTIETRPAAGHVEVRVAGETIASSHGALILEETSCPPRYYLPQSDIRMELLTPTKTVTHCPYKGDASYWSLVGDDGDGRDIAWAYLDPIPASEAIRGHLCFYPGRVDAVLVDGRDLVASRPGS